MRLSLLSYQVIIGIFQTFLLYGLNSCFDDQISVDEDTEITIGGLAQMIADAFELEHGLAFDETKSDGQYRKTASNKKLRSYLPDFKFTPLKDAIDETAKWLEENYDSARH